MADLIQSIVGTVGNVLYSSGLSIGGIRPNVTIQEVSRDNTFITSHPVERGATISDHAFMMPIELEVNCGWSDSSGGYRGYSRAIGAALRSLQVARNPFTVSSPRRIYRNMLISSLEVTTDERSSYALMVKCVLREVIIASTQSTSIGSGGSGTQADPAKTGSIQQSGTRYIESTQRSSPSFVPQGGAS